MHYIAKCCFVGFPSVPLPPPLPPSSEVRIGVQTNIAKTDTVMMIDVQLYACSMLLQMHFLKEVDLFYKI